MSEEELKRLLEEQARLKALQNIQKDSAEQPMSEEEKEALRLQVGIEPPTQKKRVGPLYLSDMVGGANQRFKNLKDILYKKIMSQPEKSEDESKKSKSKDWFLAFNNYIKTLLILSVLT